jgi:hypothetical protein
MASAQEKQKKQTNKQTQTQRNKNEKNNFKQQAKLTNNQSRYKHPAH